MTFYLIVNVKKCKHVVEKVVISKQSEIPW